MKSSSLLRPAAPSTRFCFASVPSPGTPIGRKWRFSEKKCAAPVGVLHQSELKKSILDETRPRRPRRAFVTETFAVRTIDARRATRPSARRSEPIVPTSFGSRRRARTWPRRRRPPRATISPKAPRFARRSPWSSCPRRQTKRRPARSTRSARSAPRRAESPTVPSSRAISLPRRMSCDARRTGGALACRCPRRPVGGTRRAHLAELGGHVCLRGADHAEVRSS